MSGALDRYLHDLDAIACLTAETERALARRARAGDVPAAHALVVAHLRLVVMIAGRYRGRGLDLLDLIQEGALGLMRAAQKFDPSRSRRFSGYATYWVHAAVTRALANQARMIRLPVHVEHQRGQWVKVGHALAQTLGRAPYSLLPQVG